jgi:hypothetical protein
LAVKVKIKNMFINKKRISWLVLRFDLELLILLMPTLVMLNLLNSAVYLEGLEISKLAIVLDDCGTAVLVALEVMIRLATWDCVAVDWGTTKPWACDTEFWGTMMLWVCPDVDDTIIPPDDWGIMMPWVCPEVDCGMMIPCDVPLVGRMSPTEVGGLLLLFAVFGVRSKLVIWGFVVFEGDEKMPTATFLLVGLFVWRIIFGTFVCLALIFCCGIIILGMGTFLLGAMFGYLVLAGRSKLAIGCLLEFPPVLLFGRSIPVIVALLDIVPICGRIKLVIGGLLPPLAFWLLGKIKLTWLDLLLGPELMDVTKTFFGVSFKGTFPCW